MSNAASPPPGLVAEHERHLYPHHTFTYVHSVGFIQMYKHWPKETPSEVKYEDWDRPGGTAGELAGEVEDDAGEAGDEDEHQVS